MEPKRLIEINRERERQHYDFDVIFVRLIYFLVGPPPPVQVKSINQKILSFGGGFKEPRIVPIMYFFVYLCMCFPSLGTLFWEE